LRKIRQSPPTEGKDRLIHFLASLVAEDFSRLNRPRHASRKCIPVGAWRQIPSPATIEGEQPSPSVHASRTLNIAPNTLP
jgi:hypothetical protein